MLMILWKIMYINHKIKINNKIIINKYKIIVIIIINYIY